MPSLWPQRTVPEAPAARPARLLNIPDTCWSVVKRLYVMQRSEVTRGGRLTRARVAQSALHAYQDQLARLLPPPSRLPARPRILDVGAGLAMYHVHISHFYNDTSQHFLADKSEDGVNRSTAATYREHGFWHADRLPFYNSQECAARISSASGVHRDRWHMVNATAEAVDGLGADTIDVAISLLSLGFHYPFSLYGAALARVLKPAPARLIITVRHGQHQEDQLAQNGFTCDETRSWSQRQRGKLLSCTKQDRQRRTLRTRGAGLGGRQPRAPRRVATADCSTWYCAPPAAPLPCTAGLRRSVGYRMDGGDCRAAP